MIDPDNATTAWGNTGDNFVFLDLQRDRYFRLSPEAEKAWQQERTASGALDWHQPPDFPRPNNWRFPKLSSPARHTGEFRLSKVAKAIWVQKRVERRLSHTPFLSVLNDVRRAQIRIETDIEELSDVANDTIRAFEYSKLLRTAADRCLARSIALAGCLAATGDQCQVVLGVTSLPFSAHCWAQKGDVVLNDTHEEVLRYTPILVI